MRTTVRRQYQRTLRRHGILQRAKALTLALIPDAEIILYGSRARGEASLYSDWDLLILTDLDITPELEASLWDALYTLGVEYRTVISAVIKNRCDWSTTLSQALPYHQQIAHDGVHI